MRTLNQKAFAWLEKMPPQTWLEPCSHTIACLRNERIPPESVVHECYYYASYLLAYGSKIWPCNDKSTWHKVEGLEILPLVYEKKVGKPPKNRRKQPHEVEDKYGPKMSKHGTIINCSCCGGMGHNRGGCELRKAGIRPKLQHQRNTSVPTQDLFEGEYGNEEAVIS